MYNCILCGVITNINLSLCLDCDNKLKETIEARKKYWNWPFPQNIRFNN